MRKNYFLEAFVAVELPLWGMYLTGFDPSWISLCHLVIFSGTNLRRVGLYLFSTVYNMAGWRANTRNQK